MPVPITGLTPAGMSSQPARVAGGSVGEAAGEFRQLLQDALSGVEQSQQEAATAAQRLATGDVKDVSEVMIAAEKASLALQLTIQVRNKVIEAYQEMMRIQL